MIRDLLRQAACGDRHAQGVLAAEAISFTRLGHCGVKEGLATAEVLARMTAGHPGSDTTDFVGLASVLLLRSLVVRSMGELEQSDALQAEAIQILDRIADTGDEQAAELLVQAGEMCSPAALRLSTNGAGAK